MSKVDLDAFEAHVKSEAAQHGDNYHCVVVRKIDVLGLIDEVSRLRQELAKTLEGWEWDVERRQDVYADLREKYALARAVVEAAQAHVHYTYCSAQIGCDKCACPELCGALAAYKAHVGGKEVKDG